MKGINRFLHSFSGKIVIAACLIGAVFSLRMFLAEKQKEKSAKNNRVQYAEEVSKDHVSLKEFQKNFPDAEVLVACEEDLTEDSEKDLVVIYKMGKQIRMVVVINNGGKYKITEPVPAPIENQKIQFKNIDEEGPVEFIISGEKNGNVGYAIYRMIDDEPKDLFGEGMEDCC